MQIWKIPAESRKELRKFYLSSDISQSKIVYMLLALTVALFAVSDYMSVGLSLNLIALLALRTCVIIFAFLQLNYIKRIEDVELYDKSILLFLIILVIATLTINISRPQNFLSHIIITDLAIFVFYLTIPTKFIFQTIPSVMFAIGEAAIIIGFHNGTPPEYFTSLSSLLFTIITAALISLQLHSYRWRMFQNVTNREKSERFVTIGQTALMVGHDIRNPLQNIISSLYLTEQELDSLPESQEKTNAKKELEEIRTQTDYIDKIVTDLQDFSRPLTPELTKTNIRVLLEKIVANVCIPNTIQVSIEVDNVHESLLDLTYFRRILGNLVTNAIQAMPKGGTLTIRAFNETDNTIISVEDTGIGIPENVKTRIFQPLTTTKAKGQGFGLAVVKRLVEAQGGTISFESQEGKGTKFIISLPAQQEH